MLALLIGVLVTCFAGSARAQVPAFGACPVMTVQPNFDVTQYMGQWYEQQRFFAVFQAYSDCVQAKYSLDQGNNRVIVNNTGRFPVLGYKTAIGDAVADSDNPAKLNVRFSEKQPRGDYWVLATDYTTYSVVWSCTDYNWGFKWNIQFAWILTRSRDGLSDAVTTRLTNLMSRKDIDISKFSRTNQSGC